MGLKARLARKITMTVLQRQCTVIVTMLATLGLARAWPRFHSDAMSLEWYVYLVMVLLFAIPLFKRTDS